MTTWHRSDDMLLEVVDLTTHFRTPRGVVRAVDGISFSLDAGHMLGVVGESGSGKTVLSRSIIGLTHHDYALRQMALEWGVTPLLIPEQPNVEDLWGLSIESSRAAGMVQPGDRVVITAGTQVNIPGSTNVIKVDSA